jgi:2-methylisocitrate lyase-like PEP mutase family enzyme
MENYTEARAALRTFNALLDAAEKIQEQLTTKQSGEAYDDIMRTLEELYGMMDYYEATYRPTRH